MDFARSENLLELRKGGGQHRTKDNVFTVQAKPGEHKHKKTYTQEDKDRVKNEPCYQWEQGNCRYGAECFRQHRGQSGAGGKQLTTQGLHSAALRELQLQQLHRCQRNVCYAIKAHRTLLLTAQLLNDPTLIFRTWWDQQLMTNPFILLPTLKH